MVTSTEELCEPVSRKLNKSNKGLNKKTCSHSSNVSNLMKAENIPVAHLSSLTIATLCGLLNRKVISCHSEGFCRDWKGLAHVLGFAQMQVYAWESYKDPAGKVIQEWKDTYGKEATILKLRVAFSEIGRCDFSLIDVASMIHNDLEKYWQMMASYNSRIIRSPSISADNDSDFSLLTNCHENRRTVKFQSDCNDSLSRTSNEDELLTKDDVFRKRNGLGVQIYDAFVLYVPDDVEYAVELISVLEKQYNLRLCVKDREVRCSSLFDHVKVLRLITERCRKVIIVVTAAYLKSDIHRYFFSYANSLSIRQRQHILIPCLYGDCEIPMEISICNKLYYQRSSKLWNYWDRLNQAIISEGVKFSVSERERLAKEFKASRDLAAQEAKCARESLTNGSASASNCNPSDHVNDHQHEDNQSSSLFRENSRQHNVNSSSSCSSLFANGRCSDSSHSTTSGTGSDDGCVGDGSRQQHRKKRNWIRKLVPHQIYDYRHAKKQKELEKFARELRSLALVH